MMYVIKTGAHWFYFDTYQEACDAWLPWDPTPTLNLAH